MAHLPFVDADPDRSHDLFRTQPLQCPPGAVHRLLKNLRLFAATCEDVDIVDEAHVHAFQPQSLQAVLEGAHGAIVAVVEMHGEGCGIRPRREVDRVTARRAQEASNFGGKHEIVPVLPAESMACPQFGKAMAIHRGGVEESHAGFPGAREHFLRCRLVDLAENVAERRGAEAESGDVEVRSTKFSLFSRMHVSLLK